MKTRAAIFHYNSGLRNYILYGIGERTSAHTFVTLLYETYWIAFHSTSEEK